MDRIMIPRLVALGIATACASGASPTREEIEMAEHWLERTLLTGGATSPFKFTYDDKPSGGWLGSCGFRRSRRALDEKRTEHSLTWDDDATGLRLRCAAVAYSEYPVVEWTVYLKNMGKEKTPLLEDIHGLDATFFSDANGPFTLHGIEGDSCTARSFQPYALPFEPGTTKRFAPGAADGPISGKSTDGKDGWPYFNLRGPGGGVIIAVGWPGQWASSFAYEESGIHVSAGQALTHLRLEPGEEIRTPLIALLFWRGSDLIRAQNLWRSWYMAHVLPRIGGRPQGPITHIQVGGSLASLPGVKAYLDAGVKPDICWRDAGGKDTWYPSEGGPYKDKRVWLNTGTWEPDPVRYPAGFRPFSDAVRAMGMQFLLWFEPERVGDPNSWLGTKHPEWLLPGNSAGSVLNEGDPAALKWLTDHVDGMIKSQGIDWYREDLNGSRYGEAWRKNDAVERQGMTENLHVQGHLAFWDELRRRNPSLHIDSCASGGRRNDLETMRRAVPLLRSDWSVTSFADEPLQREGNQAQTHGLSSWLPWQGAGVPRFLDSYSVRSYYLPGFGLIPPGNWSASEASRAAVRRSYQECRRIAHLMLGDFYPLTPYSVDTDRWIAWQFYRPDLDEGVVQAFRRVDAPGDILVVRLEGLNANKRYEVEDLDGGITLKNGDELMGGHAIVLRQKPGAAVLNFRATK